MSSSIKIGTISGIKITVHPTWIIAFFFIAWTITSLFQSSYESWSTLQYWIGGIIGSLALFGSVLIHELAHSLVAQRIGLPVEGITLFIFGGVSQIRGKYRRARDEFLVAFAGPLSSLIIGAIGILIWLGLRPDRGDPSIFAGIIFYLGVMNILLGVFNLLPGFPLDGGRVLRSIIWGISNSESTGSRVATSVGTLVAWGLMGFGLLQFIQGNVIGGIWMVFIGMFLQTAARGERREEELRRSVGHLPIRAAVQRTAYLAGSSERLSDVIDHVVYETGQQVVPVVESDTVIGFFTMDDARRFPPSEWTNLSVGSVVRRQDQYTVQLDADAVETLGELQARELSYAIALAGDAVIGVVSASSLEALIRFRSSDGPASNESSSV